MLRLVLIALYLAALYSGQAKLSGNLDPNGLISPGDRSGNLDPDGMTAPSPNDLTGNLDPDG